MTKGITHIILSIFFLGLAGSLCAQDNWMVHLSSIHKSYLNPAYQTSKKWEVSGASVGLNFDMGNLNVGDFISQSEGVNVLSLDKLAAAVDNKSEVGISGQFNTLDLAIKWGGLTLTGGHSINYELATVPNSTAIDIAAHGNAAYIGQTVELGMPASVSAYQKMYVGVAGQFANLSWGARAAYLNGWHHMHTQRLSSKLTTGADYYELTIANDIEIYNAGIFEYNAIDDIEFIKGINDYRTLFTANHGFSLDLGVDLKINEGTGVFASALNLGSITWVDRAQKLTNNSTTLLKGVDLEKIIDGEDNSNLEDTLLNAFALEQQNVEFSRKISPSFNAGAYFTWADTKFSAVIHLKQLADLNQPSVYLQASRPLIAWLQAGVNYHWREGAPFNLGLMLNAKLGPFNIFGVCNNAWALLNPSRINGLSGRIGASLGF